MSLSVENKCDSEIMEKRGSQWEVLMRKFSEANKDQCRALTLDIPCVMRSLKQFPTGSTYEGTWDVLGMSGYGTYTFPNGVIYKGEFDDGMFHGRGDLIYPSGAILRGKWKKGVITEKTLIFADGLEYDELDWDYCKVPDRRFTIEYTNGLKPAGESYLTAEQPTRDIPLGYYDTGDGFYDPKTKVVYDANDLSRIIRSPTYREQKWILDNCRTNPMKPLGPRPDLYEKWQAPDLFEQSPYMPESRKSKCTFEHKLPQALYDSRNEDTKGLESRKYLEDLMSETSSSSSSSVFED